MTNKAGSRASHVTLLLSNAAGAGAGIGSVMKIEGHLHGERFTAESTLNILRICAESFLRVIVGLSTFLHGISSDILHVHAHSAYRLITKSVMEV